MSQSRPCKHYRCRFCGRELPAWLPVAKRPDGPMLLKHLSTIHPTEVGPYLERMRTEDIATVAAEASEWTLRLARHGSSLIPLPIGPLR
jgi:hypothetical protein